MHFLEFDDTIYNLNNVRKIRVKALGESSVSVEVDGEAEMRMSVPEGLAKEVATDLLLLIKQLMKGEWEAQGFFTLHLRDVENEDVENYGIAEFLLEA